jgi:hypothetical protein
MSEIVLSRILSRVLAPPAKDSRRTKDSGHGLQDKSAARGRAHVVGGIGVFSCIAAFTVGSRRQFANKFNMRSANAVEIRKTPRHGRA